MSVTSERFEQGLTYAEYKAQMTRNRERLEENEQAARLDPADLAHFRGLPSPLRVLALVEDWCGDVLNNLPVLARMAEESGKLDLRIFLRDQNLDIMDQYLNQGQHRSIPVFAFFDADMRPIGHWIERPAQIAELMAELRRGLWDSDPAFAGVEPGASPGELPEAARTRLMAAFAEFRATNRDLADREVIREIRALLAQPARSAIAGTAPAAASAPAPRAPAAAPAPAAPAPSRIEELRRRAADGPRAARPLKVSITYCAACGYEPQTLELTSALMHTFLYDLAAIELIPWQDGAFDVVVDGELVHSMHRDGGFPASDAIIAAVRARLG